LPVASPFHYIKVEVDLAASCSQEGGGQQRWTWPAKGDLAAGEEEVKEGSYLLVTVTMITIKIA